jgi:MoaF C-terminal domain/MoaF N-terminal domain
MTEPKPTAFVQVGDFVKNFGGNELEHSDDLAGRVFDIHFENGWVVRHSFRAGGQLEWQMLQGADPDPAAPERDVECYRATCLREGYYLVDFVKRSQPTRSVSLVLDLTQMAVTAVLTRMPTREETYKPLFQRVLDGEPLSPMRVAVVHGAIGRAPQAQLPRHAPTTELVGKRVRYQYGPRDAYEHIYLSREFYTWNCLQGPEAGLADTDACGYYKLAEKLYLFVWWEKVIPTLGVVMLDFARNKTSGKIFGYREGDFGATCNTPVGAVLTVMNETRYDLETVQV